MYQTYASMYYVFVIVVYFCQIHTNDFLKSLNFSILIIKVPYSTIDLSMSYWNRIANNIFTWVTKILSSFPSLTQFSSPLIEVNNILLHQYE